MPDSEILRLNVRVFVGGVLQSEERVDVQNRDALALPDLARKHATILTDAIIFGDTGIIEIEFLDEPEVNKRFFRMGTDKSGMLRPEPIDPDDPESALRKWEGLTCFLPFFVLFSNDFLAICLI